MKILNVKIDPVLDFDNISYFKILVDKIPEDMVYECKDNHYFAENDGYVEFFYYVRPGEGYGGRHFTLNMKDGTQKVLKGPWSSNSKSMSDAGFPETVNVSITDKQKVWERGYTFLSGHITFDLFKQAAEEFNFDYAWDKYGFINAIPKCECGERSFQKYRIDNLVKSLYNDSMVMGRKFLCEKCSHKYELNSTPHSNQLFHYDPQISYRNQECSNGQVQIL